MGEVPRNPGDWKPGDGPRPEETVIVQSPVDQSKHRALKDGELPDLVGDIVVGIDAVTVHRASIGVGGVTTRFDGVTREDAAQRLVDHLRSAGWSTESTEYLCQVLGIDPDDIEL